MNRYELRDDLIIDTDDGLRIYINDKKSLLDKINDEDRKYKKEIESLKDEDKRLNDIIIDLHKQIGELKKVKRKYQDIILSQKDLIEIFFNDLVD